MKLEKIALAYRVVCQLFEKECDYQSAYRLVMLKNKLQPHAEFFAKKEMALAVRFGEKGKDGKLKLSDDGRFSFASDADREAYVSERTALAQVDVSDDWEPITLTAPDTIRPAQMEALSPFAVFAPKEGA